LALSSLSKTVDSISPLSCIPKSERALLLVLESPDAVLDLDGSRRESLILEHLIDSNTTNSQNEDPPHMVIESRSRFTAGASGCASLVVMIYKKCLWTKVKRPKIVCLQEIVRLTF